MIWGYSVEIIASILIWLLIRQALGAVTIAHFMLSRKTDFFFTIGLAAAICGLFFAAFVTFMCTDFGKRFRKAGAAVDYLIGFLTPFLAFAAVAGTLHFLSNESPLFLGDLILILLIYSAINCITMAKNLIGIARIWQEIDQVRG